MLDLLGHFIRATPPFRGRQRLIHFWVHHTGQRGCRPRFLPGGARISCDVSVPYEAMIWLEEEEETDLHVLQALLQPGQVFVDAGANIGLWTLVAAKVVGPTGRVCAFEPNPATFEKLAGHVAANGLSKRVELFNTACGNDEGRLPFRCSHAHNISQIVSKQAADTISVPVARLDTILRDRVVHGLKLDVEGSELEALRGAEALLLRHRPWLCVEFNTLLNGLKKLGDWPVHRYLTGRGYRCRPFAAALTGNRDEDLPSDWIAPGYCNLFYEPPGHLKR